MAETRIALVTGGNRGIGFEIVKQLSRAGVLAVMGARDMAKGKAAAETLVSEGFEVPVVALDVAMPESCKVGVAETIRLMGGLDILINNAGILEESFSLDQSSVFQLTGERALRAWETNVLGPLRMTQAAVPHMREKGYGRIVNISSIAGQLVEMGAGYPAYRMSKAALNAQTRIVAAELASGGDFKVNAMCPGWCRTDMGGANATRSAAEGAETAVWLSLLPEDGPTASFFKDKKPIAW
jgi:NAD(P)-dependent dehydrogenase (short-subunit alcohol dehydrogenase family)